MDQRDKSALREPGITEPRQIKTRDRLQNAVDKVAPNKYMRCLAQEEIPDGSLFFVDIETGKAALTLEKTR